MFLSVGVMCEQCVLGGGTNPLAVVSGRAFSISCCSDPL